MVNTEPLYLTIQSRFNNILVLIAEMPPVSAAEAIISLAGIGNTLDAIDRVSIPERIGLINEIKEQLKQMITKVIQLKEADQLDRENLANAWMGTVLAVIKYLENNGLSEENIHAYLIAHIEDIARYMPESLHPKRLKKVPEETRGYKNAG